MAVGVFQMEATIFLDVEAFVFNTSTGSVQAFHRSLPAWFARVSTLWAVGIKLVSHLKVVVLGSANCIGLLSLQTSIFKEW